MLHGNARLAPISALREARAVPSSEKASDGKPELNVSLRRVFTYGLTLPPQTEAPLLIKNPQALTDRNGICGAQAAAHLRLLFPNGKPVPLGRLIAAVPSTESLRCDVRLAPANGAPKMTFDPRLRLGKSTLYSACAGSRVTSSMDRGLVFGADIAKTRAGQDPDPSSFSPISVGRRERSAPVVTIAGALHPIVSVLG